MGSKTTAVVSNGGRISDIEHRFFVYFNTACCAKCHSEILDPFFILFYYTRASQSPSDHMLVQQLFFLSYLDINKTKIVLI